MSPVGKHQSVRYNSRWYQLSVSRVSPVLFLAFLVSPMPSVYGDDIQSASASSELEEVIVIGSRIRQEADSHLDNIQEISSDELDRTGLVSIGDILRQVPTAGSPLNTQFNSSGNFGFPPDGGGVGAGETHVDLRHLGSKRVLLLVDGLRWINGSSGSGVGGAVDLNTIPLSLIERVEILEDGASAIYGSDALAGVVNIVTKTRQQGLQVELYTGSYSDGGESFKLSLVSGMQGSWWRAVGGMSYTDQTALDASTRELSRYPKPNTDIRHGSTFTPQGRVIFTDPNTGTFINCALNEGVNDPVYDPSNPCGDSDSYHPWSNADRFNYAQYNLLLTPSERMGWFGKFQFDLTETTGFTAKAVLNQRKSLNRAAPEPLWLGQFGESGSLLDTISIHHTNPFNHFGFDIGPEGTFITRRPLESGPRIFDQTVDTVYVSAQLSGLSEFFGNGYFWDANVVTSKNSADQRKQGAHNARKLKQALGPIEECISPCVPFNFLGGAGTITQEMLDWVGFIQRDQSEQSLLSVSFNLSGDFLALPAGALAVATGFEYRALEGSFTPDPIVSAGDTAGIPAQPTQGDYTINELYLETEIPLVQGVKGAFAIRAFDYSTFGSDTTAKAALIWDPIPSLRVRVHVAEGFRAPNIGELYGGRTRFDASIADPCADLSNNGNARVVANCINQGVPEDGSYIQLSSQIAVLTGGNRELTPETGTGTTLKLTYEPEWFEHLSLQLSKYRHSIDDTITAFDAQTVLNNCYLEDIVDFCGFIQRNEVGGIAQFTNTLFNIGTIKTSGTDYGVTYKRSFEKVGELVVTYDATYLSSFQEIARDAVGVEIKRRELAGRSDADRGKPKLKYTTKIGWYKDPWQASWTGRFIDKMMERCSDFLDGSPDSFTTLGLCSHPNAMEHSASENELQSIFYHNVHLSYRQAMRGFQISYVLGINNLFDADTPTSYSASLNGYDASTHEIPESRYTYFRISLVTQELTE